MISNRRRWQLVGSILNEMLFLLEAEDGFIDNEAARDVLKQRLNIKVSDLLSMIPLEDHDIVEMRAEREAQLEGKLMVCEVEEGPEKIVPLHRVTDFRGEGEEDAQGEEANRG